jgi:transcription-repair coupling factor (superfamily II helicase)
MKTKLKESIVINNASKDSTEFFICNLSAKIQKPLIFINIDFTEERIIKNFKFLNSNLRVIFLEESAEVYSMQAGSLLSYGERNYRINQVLKGNFDVLFLDYKLLLKKLPPIEFFTETISLELGQKFGHSNLVKKLFDFGFLRCETVFDFAEFAVRGFIIDIGILDGFFRVEFDGEVVSSIAKFNTESQRKITNSFMEKLEIYKIKDVVLTESSMQEARQNAFNIGFEDIDLAINDISNFGGINLAPFLPLFYEKMTNILDFTPKDALFVLTENLPQALEVFTKDANSLYELYKKEGRGFLSPNLLLYDRNLI